MLELESMYFGWLYAKVVQTPNNTPYTRYEKLMRELHTTEFVWQISGDDNRAEDGVDLRHEFLVEHGLRDTSWKDADGCSMLEMLIAFSRRCEFQTEESAHDWFWEMLENLGLSRFNDGAFPDDESVADILDDFNWRRYSIDGRGGLFPIEHPSEDQRGVEIWYQFCEYLADQDRLL